MDVATGAMGNLLGKLGKFLVEEYKLQTSVKEDIQYLERELRSMHAALRMVDDVPRDQLNELVKLWADEIRDLSYTMEDIFDKFLVRVEGTEPAVQPHKLKKLMKKMQNLFTKVMTRHAIGREIKGIKARVQEVADRRDKYRVDEVVANRAGTTTVDPRVLALYKDRKELVGIDGSSKELTKMLAVGNGNVSNKLKILSIFGSGGLGKTTLVKAVFDKLQGQFECTAFVSVGQRPSMKELLNDILFKIEKKKYPDLDETQLIDKLRELLENKRYFIVIDDLWDLETWKMVKCALVHTNCASRIITTTRNLEVAEGTGDPVYRLNPLSHDLSEELFHTQFSGGKKIPYDQSAMVKKILQKCGGVPLAIITIATVLAGKPVEVWSKVYNSIGFGDGHNKDVENTRKILLFSYYNLPCHLRTCLLYMSIYREDHLIEKDSLIWRWVAEGFVREEEGVGVFEIGERYFNELINKSMIQPVEIPHHGIINGCRVHDMVLDIIRPLAEEENFITILDGNNPHRHPVQSNVRRLAIGNRNRVVDNTHMPQVRSFIAMYLNEYQPPLRRFQVLRVLALDAGTSSEHDTNATKHLGKLVHLRYLELGMNILRLPRGLGDLKFLQTLDLCGVRLQELPQSVGQLSHLKCLRIEETNTRVPDWIGNLMSLEMLCLNNVDGPSNFVNELGKLTELRKLCISGTLCLLGASREKAWAESLVKLQKIQVIDIGRVETRGCDGVTCSWEGYVLSRKLHVLKMSYRQPGLLQRINSSLLPSLSYLSVHVDNTDLEIFGMFSELVSLHLQMPRGLQHDTMGGLGAFPKLRCFKTDATPSRFLGDMPSLESLVFRIELRRGSNVDDDFDFGSLVNLPSLQIVTVRIWHAPSADIDKAEEVVRHAINILPNHPGLYLQRIEARDLEDSQAD